MKRLLILALMILGSGCATEQVTERTVYINTKLPLPERPVLPTWEPKDMACLDDLTKIKMKERDRMRKNYAEELEEIIKSTHH
jgi:hypothetical protein